MLRYPQAMGARSIETRTSFAYYIADICLPLQKYAERTPTLSVVASWPAKSVTSAPGRRLTKIALSSCGPHPLRNPARRGFGSWPSVGRGTGGAGFGFGLDRAGGRVASVVEADELASEVPVYRGTPRPSKLAMPVFG